VKIIDYIIITAVLGCLGLAYSGHRIAAFFLLVAIVTVASWRFWDKARAGQAMHGASGDNLPDHHDATFGSEGDFSHGGAEHGGGDSSFGGDGGGD
jgi:hypothetical protein